LQKLGLPSKKSEISGVKNHLFAAGRLKTPAFVIFTSYHICMPHAAATPSDNFARWQIEYNEIIKVL
jgi:hypothetical protein